MVTTRCSAYTWIVVLALLLWSCSSSRTPVDGGIDATADTDSGSEDANLDGGADDVFADSTTADTACRGMDEPCTVNEDCCSLACSDRVGICGMSIDP